MLSAVLLPKSVKRFAREGLLLILAIVLNKKVLFISIGKSIYILSKTYTKVF